MKFSVILALFLTIFTSSQSVRADSVEQLIEVTSDAFPGAAFRFAVGTNSQGDINAISYRDGSGKTTVFSLGQARAGVVLMHNDSPSRDVIILKTDGAFTGKDGGKINIEFLVNGLRPHSYGNFVLDMVRGGVTWLPYALDRAGSRAARPFGHMKFVANHILGQVVGVSFIQTW